MALVRLTRAHADITMAKDELDQPDQLFVWQMTYVMTSSLCKGVSRI